MTPKRFLHPRGASPTLLCALMMCIAITHCDDTPEQQSCDPLSFVTTELEEGQVDEPYSAAIEVNGGEAPVVFALSAAGGQLPSGLVIHPATGMLEGTPLEAGDFSFSVLVTDACVRAGGQQIARDFDLTVGPGESSVYRVADLQNPALGHQPAGNAVVELENVIVTSPVLRPFSSGRWTGFFVQEEETEPYSGIHVAANVDNDPELLAYLEETIAPGLNVNIQGFYQSFHGRDQIVINEAEQITINGMAEVPAPVVVASPFLIGSTENQDETFSYGELTDEYESMLVRVEDVVVTEAINDFGVFVVTGNVHVDDSFCNFDDGTQCFVNEYYIQQDRRLDAVQGPLFFSWDLFSILPRDSSEL